MSNSKRLLSVFLAAAAVICVLHAEDKIIAQIGSDTPRKVLRGSFAWENGVFKCKLPCQVVFPSRVKVNPSKLYSLSGEFRSTSGSPTQDNVWYGFLCFNEAGREITPRALNRTTPVLAELAEPAAKGAKEIVFKSLPPVWEKLLQNNRYFAVDAKEDRSDLPNLNIVCAAGKSAKKRDDGTVAVKLLTPLPVAADAGTKFAIHSDGNTYQFVTPQKAGAEWTGFSGSYAVKAESGITAFRPTTDSIAFGFFCRDKEGEIEVRNLRLVESDD